MPGNGNRNQIYVYPSKEASWLEQWKLKEGSVSGPGWGAAELTFAGSWLLSLRFVHLQVPVKSHCRLHASLFTGVSFICYEADVSINSAPVAALQRKSMLIAVTIVRPRKGVATVSEPTQVEMTARVLLRSLKCLHGVCGHHSVHSRTVPSPPVEALCPLASNSLLPLPSSR